MKQFIKSVFVLLLLQITASFAFIEPLQSTKLTSSTIKIHVSSVQPSILSLRGGASKKKKTKAVNIQEDDGNFLMKKVRNIIRSFLNASDRKVPFVSVIVKGVLGTMEMISGISLLPKEMDYDEEADATVSSKKKTKASTKAKESKKSSKKSSTTTKAKNTGQAQSHVNKELKMTNPNYRIQRELKEFLKAPPPNLSVKVGKNIRIWIITMKGTKGSLYEGETYRLRVQFPPNYPTEPPSVYFLQPTPRHEHVYTNGDICLSLLGKDWRPNMTAQSIAMSILSILSGAGRKSLPMDNAAHAQNKAGQKQDDWVYHDDNC